MNTKLYIALFFFSIDDNVNFLLEKVMSEIYGVKKLNVGKTSSGKPVIVSPKGWFYNISHSNDLGICAIGSMELGIDLEYIKKKRDYLSIAETWFTADEYKKINTPGKKGRELFYHLWTRKESVIKQKGKSVWNMKSMPDMSDKIDNIQSWAIVKGKENYSLSLSAALQENTKLEMCFLEDYYNISLSIEELTFPL